MGEVSLRAVSHAMKPVSRIGMSGRGASTVGGTGASISDASVRRSTTEHAGSARATSKVGTERRMPER